MGLLDELKRKENWCAFFEHKKEKGHIYKKYEKALGDFIEEEKYLEKVEKITEGSFVFSPPEKVYISKNENKEKRCVYVFEEEEGYILKCLCHLMYKYDYLMNENCYSFRKNKSAHTAVKKIKAIKYKDEKYCVKLDIHNYFNSIPQEELARVIEEEIKDDIALRDFLTRFVKDKRVKVGEEIVYEDKGAMAGCPLSSFFANIYLKSLDEYFSKNVKYYFRYSDDILFFADTLEEARHLTEVLKSEIEKRGLEVNGKKTLIYPPHSGFEFLGFFIKGECVDIAPHAKQKLKNKMRRKARALYRWRREKNTEGIYGVRAFIKRFNKKFYYKNENRELSWSRWYFDIINTDVSLREIDRYFLSMVRYINTGKHNKKNYKLKYETIKSLGYRSLVNEYYKNDG